jgi:protein ImuA
MNFKNDSRKLDEVSARDSQWRDLVARVRAIEASSGHSPATGGGDGGSPTRSALGSGSGSVPPLPLGVAEIDARLGGGIAAGSLHEISGSAEDGAAPGFAAVLRAGVARRGPVVWISACRAALYAPGLAALGLVPARLLTIDAAARAQRLWAFEETLRAGAPVAVLAELDNVDFNASRRFQLAAATNRIAALILDQGPERTHHSAARTRWRIAAAGSAPDPSCVPRHASRADGSIADDSMRATDTGFGPGAPRWHVALRRAAHGRPGAWLLEHAATGLRLVAAGRAATVPPVPAPASGDHIAGPAHGPTLPGALAALPAARQARAG